MPFRRWWTWPTERIDQKEDKQLMTSLSNSCSKRLLQKGRKSRMQPRISFFSVETVSLLDRFCFSALNWSVNHIVQLVLRDKHGSCFRLKCQFCFHFGFEYLIEKFYIDILSLARVWNSFFIFWMGTTLILSIQPGIVCICELAECL